LPGTRRRTAFITLLTGISIAGVALGVTALLTVLAVMNGFENEIQSRIAGTDAHVVLLGESQGAIRGGDSLATRAANQPGVLGAAPFTYAKAMVIHGGRAEGLVVKGVDLARERRVTTVAHNISPSLDAIPSDAATPSVVLGTELSARIGAAVGDTVVLASLRRHLEPAYRPLRSAPSKDLAFARVGKTSQAPRDTARPPTTPHQ